MINKITVAKNSGFCFGVKRACDSLESKLDSKTPNERVFTLGYLIHNEEYIKYLNGRGTSVIDETDIERICDEADKASPTTVFVRAHGIAREVEKQLLDCQSKNPYFHVVDCTCPYVKKIHRIAEQNSDEDRVFILLGHSEHPETIGIMSRFDGEKYVFRTAKETEEAYESGILDSIKQKTAVLAAQTTQNLAEWKKNEKFLKNLCTNPIIFDTICSVTENRQTEARILAAESDTMIVLGSENSSNTHKLFNICKELCNNTHLIGNVSNLANIIPSIHGNVGIAAGASTPQSLIQEVQKKMSEVNEIKEENFEELLNQQFSKTLNTGDTVTGIVTSVSTGEIQLDLGAKVTGRIEADQITDDPSVKLNEMFKIGDEVEAFVIRVSDIDGFATLSKKRTDSDKNWTKIVAAAESGEILEGKVVEITKGGAVVLTEAVRVFIPASQTGVPKSGDLSTLNGQTVKFKVIEIKPQGKKAIGSIRAVLREERQAKEAAFWAEIENGKTYTGVVKSMTTYGAFVDLGGVDGMVHVQELSWKRIKSPAEVLSIGDTVTVFVKSFDAEARRISLGYKTEDTNPWTIFTNKYAVGDVAAVTIVNMMPFGAFAEICDGVDGLIHISQIAQTRIAKPADVLTIGQVVDAKIIDIDMENQKVSLSIRALLDEASAEAEVAEIEAEAAEAEAEAATKDATVAE